MGPLGSPMVVLQLSKGRVRRRNGGTETIQRKCAVEPGQTGRVVCVVKERINIIYLIRKRTQSSDKHNNKKCAREKRLGREVGGLNALSHISKVIEKRCIIYIK